MGEKKDMTQLFVTDLDQTFLHSDLTFNAAWFAEILDQIDARGDQFAIATGRETKWVKMKFGDLADRVHLVTNNGASWQARGSQDIHVKTIKHDILPDLEEALLAGHPDAGIHAYTATDMYRLNGYADLGTEFQAFAEKVYQTIKMVDHLADIPDPVVSVTAVVDVDESEATLARVRDLQGPLHPTTSGYGSIDILPADVNKATSLTELIAELGIASADVTVFGDGMNDLEMMQLAGKVYLMPNSDERLFGRGFDQVTRDNNHDGVLAKLADILA